jgi:hypothetical protein
VCDKAESGLDRDEHQVQADADPKCPVETGPGMRIVAMTVAVTMAVAVMMVVVSGQHESPKVARRLSLHLRVILGRWLYQLRIDRSAANLPASQSR